MTDPNLQRAVARQELARRLLAVALVAFMVGISLSFLGISWQIRRTQLEGSPTGQRLLASSDAVLDCTSPEGECFKRSQKRTADVVATLNLGTVYAVFCVNRNPGADIADIQKCVRSLYDAPSDGE